MREDKVARNRACSRKVKVLDWRQTFLRVFYEKAKAFETRTKKIRNCEKPNASGVYHRWRFALVGLTDRRSHDKPWRF